MSTSILQPAALQSALMASANFSGIATDHQGLIQIFSKGAEGMLGYTSEEVVNKIHLADLADQEALSTRATALNLTWTGGVQDGFDVLVSHAAKGQEDVYGLTYICNDGARLVAQVTAMALRDESKSIIGYWFVNTELKANSIDATSRANPIDATWRESEARFSTLCDMGVMGIYSCDKSGVIQKFNSRAAGLWGREPVLGEVGERYCGSFKMLQMDNTHIPHDQGPMADIVSGRVTEVRDQEILIERPDGSRLAVMVNIRRIQNEQGEMTGAINCFQDITQRRKTDAQLRHNQDTFPAGGTAEESARSDTLGNQLPAHTLLCIEDNPANMTLVQQIMHEYPQVSMLAATTGNRGIELARTRMPDIILMDINLPDINGVEALRILREGVTTQHIPVVALSANALAQNIEAGLAAGFFRYLTKPIRVDELITALDDALKTSRNN